MRPPNDAERMLAAALEALTPETTAPPGLRERLQDRIAREGWESTPYAGVLRRTLHVDPVTGYVTSLVRMAPGAIIRSHVHSRDEQCYVIEGDIRIDSDVYRGGDFVVSRGGLPVPEASTVHGNLLLIVGTPDGRPV